MRILLYTSLWLPLLQAPGAYASDGRMLTAGTAVDIGACFGEGAYCFVQTDKDAGYVEGRLLEVAAGRKDELEKAR